MKKTIKNPYKVSNKIYIVLLCVSVLVLIISMFFLQASCAFLINVGDIFKNLSYGCIASTIVAWLIDCANIRNMNKKANNVYDAIYADLKFQISYYIGLWAQICAVVYKDVDYHQEQKGWKDWYYTVKENYLKSEEKRQEEIFRFLQDQLKSCVENINKSISEVYNQRYLLIINDLHDSKMEQIISDFKFEFYALESTISIVSDIDTFWSHMDAITSDIENYINAWIDISYYNKLKFKPYNFHSDTIATIKAILLDDGISENLINYALSKQNDNHF